MSDWEYDGSVDDEDFDVGHWDGGGGPWNAPINGQLPLGANPNHAQHMQNLGVQQHHQNQMQNMQPVPAAAMQQHQQNAMHHHAPHQHLAPHPHQPLLPAPPAPPAPQPAPMLAPPQPLPPANQPVYQQVALPVPAPHPPTIIKDPFIGHSSDSTYVIPTMKGESRFSVQGFHWLRLHGSERVANPDAVETIKAPKIRLANHDYWFEFLPNRDCLNTGYNSDMFVMVGVTDVDKNENKDSTGCDDSRSTDTCSNSSSCNFSTSPASPASASSSLETPKKTEKPKSKNPLAGMPRFGTVQIAVKVIQHGEDKHLVDCGFHSLKFDDKGKSSLGFALMSPVLNQATELLVYISLEVVTGDGSWVTSKREELVRQPIPNTLCEDFMGLLTTGNGADATIKAAGGESRQVHSLILGSRSPVFSTMFSSAFREGKASPGRVISMEDVNIGTLDRFLEFLYTGFIATQLVGELLEPWCVDDCLALAHLAHKYDVPSLVDCVVKKLTRLLSPSNVARIITFADRYSCPALKQAACKFATKDPNILQQMQASPEFAKLDIDCLRALLGATTRAGIPMPTPRKLPSQLSWPGIRGTKRPHPEHSSSGVSTNSGGSSPSTGGSSPSSAPSMA